MKKSEKSKYYWDFDRNLDNAKQMNQTEDRRVPEYYKGRNQYEARKVCDNFDLTYHLGTAVTYILRAYHKHETPIECLSKAIAHLQFEIEKYEELEKSR
jgi:hypothetical protein